MKDFLKEKRARAAVSLVLIISSAFLVLGAMLYTLVMTRVPFFWLMAFGIVGSRLYVHLRRAFLVALIKLRGAQLALIQLKHFGEDGWKKPGEERQCLGP